MYAHKVPLHLETEDTFLFHLTLRQCVVLALGCTVAYTSFVSSLTPTHTAFGFVSGLVTALLVVSGAGALAFVKIFGRALEEWSLVLLIYLLQPRLYLWRFASPDTFEPFDQCAQGYQAPPPENEEETW